MFGHLRGLPVAVRLRTREKLNAITTALPPSSLGFWVYAYAGTGWLLACLQAIKFVVDGFH
jgi:hypothetical protein